MRRVLARAALLAAAGVGLVAVAPASAPPAGAQAATWALEETFDGAPGSPSQALLPRTFDYEVTHRHHMFHPDGWPVAPSSGGLYGHYPADHGPDCAPPDATHTAKTSHRTHGADPDRAFYICRDHMMSAHALTGNKYYGILSFFPRQEFDFAGGGVLEFDVNFNRLTDDPTNNTWFEVVISPREQFVAAPARHFRAWDGDRYPKDRIILSVLHGGAGGWQRDISVGTGAIEPGGIVGHAADGNGWEARYPSDPANGDAKIRRKQRIELTSTGIVWHSQKQDGTFDSLTLNTRIPFGRGIVNFKVHNSGGGNTGATGPGEWLPGTPRHTFHWDTIRFSGPVLAPYVAHEIPGVVDLQKSNPVGMTATQTLDLPAIGGGAVLTGQTHGGSPGHILLSVNGGPDRVVTPLLHPDQANVQHGSPAHTSTYCFFGGWRQFRIPLAPSELRAGANTFTWKVGPRTPCTTQQWWPNGFAVKSVEIQSDGRAGSVSPATATPVPPTPTATTSATVTLTPTMAPTATPLPVSWVSFEFGEVGSRTTPVAFSHDGPSVLRVTDTACRGDRFQVLDNGVSLGATSSVPIRPCSSEGTASNPDEAYGRPDYSHAAFSLAPGHHAITIVVLTSPFGGGSGALRVDPMP